ncbi:unnamed protein product [Caenorhabditis auriculariae]|uniref:BZIP domain-containing protein n=1 Tax=Caenorhabditis auriculariae TaxID=2777116 RepID=A0A8S1H181_9PELO|nr:unnamed protein product [Caenorhabditis auriculariae]
MELETLQTNSNDSFDDFVPFQTFPQLQDIDIDEYLFGLEGFQDSPCSTMPAASSESSDSSPPLSCVNDAEQWDFNAQSAFSDCVYEQETLFVQEPQCSTSPPLTPIQPRPVVQNIVECKQIASNNGRKIYTIASRPEPIPFIRREDLLYSADENRKMRNRMSAQASRIRKKQEVDTLKRDLEILQQENNSLKEENRQLRERLAVYEGEHLPSKPTVLHRVFPNQPFRIRPKIVAAGSMLMAFGIIAIVNPFSPAALEISKSSIIPASNATRNGSIVHRGRVLPLEVYPSKDAYEIQSAKNASNAPSCTSKLNATEARRVTNDIDIWIKKHSFGGLRPKHGLSSEEAINEFYANSYLTPAPEATKPNNVKSRTEKAVFRSRARTWKQLEMLDLNTQSKSNIELSGFRKKDQIAKLAKSLRQKRDTLYLMTLKDYVLLPALKTKDNAMPKISLILPAFPFNGTHLDEYSLLRIDCDITGTAQLTFPNRMLSTLVP